MLAVLQVPFDDRSKCGIEDESADSPSISEANREIAAAKIETTGFHDPAGLGECTNPIVVLHEVIERPQQEHGVVRSVGLLKISGVADGGGKGRWRSGCAARFVDLARHGIDQMHRMSLGGEPDE